MLQKSFLKSSLALDAQYVSPDTALYVADATDLLATIPEGTIDLIFLDPPFNLGKAYGNSDPSRDSLADADYFSYLSTILRDASSLLTDGGALFLYHLPVWAIRFGKLLDDHLTFRHWIAISLKNGFARGNKLYPAHYSLLYFTKGEPCTFSRPKIPTPTCRHCGKYIKDYGGYTKYVADGINLSDVWDDVSPVRHPANKHRAGNELPPVIAERVAQISGKEGGVFLDPFMGAGSSLVAMREAGMRVLGADREETMVQLVAQRLGLSHHKSQEASDVQQ